MKTRKGYKVYPLTAAQKMHFYYQQYCPKKQVLNIGSYLAIQVELDFGLLKESVYEAYARCDSMRLRFAKDKDVLWSSFFVTLVAKKYRLATMLPFVPRMVCDSR